jgi:hypothetical protein
MFKDVQSVVGKINYFMFKALIFWKKLKVSLAVENYCPVELEKMFKK